ncbi:hypothetical protein IJI02_01240 [Candidatus Saccharibacteria bacterium]|nr:hypothetical protein [Candidatus Saccharibacteria bacterium]
MTEKKTQEKQSQTASRPRTMSVAECKLQTIAHIEEVRKNIRWFTDKLTSRGVNHDRSKLESPEVEAFAERTARLAQVEYGSEAYNHELEELKSTLEHHYAKNRHHPEHFDRGIDDMNLVDLIEMFCDWRAATMRNKNGNLLKSIEINAQRFRIDGQLEQIFVNTAKAIDEVE